MNDAETRRWRGLSPDAQTAEMRRLWDQLDYGDQLLLKIILKHMIRRAA